MVMGSAAALEIKSDAYGDGGNIPFRYAYNGENISPSFEWKGTPQNTRSFALVMDDPDAPKGTWVHWVIYDIPGTKNSLEENIPKEKILPDGSKQGINDFSGIGYDGPSPPPGLAHRYVATLYALDTELGAGPGLTKEELLKKIKKHVLDKATFTGLFAQ